MRNLALIVICLYMFVATAVPQVSGTSVGGGISPKDNCGFVFGKEHVFMLCAPKEWVLDNSIGNEEGIYAAFYPKGQTWESARNLGTVMYVNTATKKVENETIEGLIATDAEDIKQSAPKVFIRRGEDIPLGENKAPVQFFEHAGFDRFEAVAYVDSTKVIVMFVMTSKDGATFKRDFPAFVQLVNSYSFVGSEVEIKHPEHPLPQTTQ